MEKFDVVDYKILICGDKGVGKTSLIHRYMFNDAVKQNDKVSFYLYSFPSIQNVAVWIWDIVGGGIIRLYVKPYIPKMNFAVICYDISERKTFENIPKWIKEVKELSKDIEFGIIGNKSDILEREVEYDEGEKFASENNCVFLGEVSAKTGYRIKEVFENEMKKIVLKDDYVNEGINEQAAKKSVTAVNVEKMN